VQDKLSYLETTDQINAFSSVQINSPAQKVMCLHEFLAHAGTATICKGIDNGMYSELKLTSVMVKAANIELLCEGCFMGKLDPRSTIHHSQEAEPKLYAIGEKSATDTIWGLGSGQTDSSLDRSGREDQVHPLQAGLSSAASLCPSDSGGQDSRRMLSQQTQDLYHAGHAKN
jgi:hypothetical protein